MFAIKNMNYLHAHTDYSNLKMRDCIIKVEQAARHPYTLGSTAACITDHDSMSGHIKFLNEVKTMRAEGKELYEKNPTADNLRLKNYKAILGNEIYLASEGMSADTWVPGTRFYHLILLAKNRKGWEQLNELSTRAWSRTFRRAVVRVPTYLSDLQEIVGGNPGHLICTSACIGNYLGDKILSFHQTKSEETKQQIFDYIYTMKELFGEDFYLEIQPAEYEDQVIYNSWLKTFSEATKVPLVVTTDTHYLTEADREVHAAFLNSQADLVGERETDAFYRYTYFQTVDEVKKHLSLSPNLTKEDIQGAIQRTHEIVDKCENYDISSPIYVPTVDERDVGWEKFIHKYDVVPAFKLFSHSEYEIDRYFIYKVISGYEDKIKKGLVEKSQKEFDRMELELNTFWTISDRIEQRLSNYFNTMQEILNKIWEISVVGPGRGSAGGSFLNFVLNITQVNPLTTPVELPFWRFIHESRPELPDIDIDSSSSKKDEIYDLLAEWFQSQNKTVSKVATFTREKPKSALITAARGLGYDPEEGLYLASLVPVDRGFPRELEVCMNGNDDYKPIREFQQAMQEYPDVYNVALNIEGLINAVSQHAAAIVIVDNNDLYSRTSLMSSPKGSVTAYSLDDLEEETGLVKYDMLQTDAVDAIQTTLLLLAEYGYIDWEGSLRETYNKYLHPSIINYDNREMWEKANNNEIISLFQWEASPQGRQGMEVAKPSNLREMAAVNSALRLMANEHHPELPLITYAKQKANPSLWYDSMAEYGLTNEEVLTLEEHLADNYGVCIEQELAMTLAMDERVAGFDMTEANRLRRVIARKIIKDVEEMKEFFYEKGRALGTRKQMLDYVWYEAFELQMSYAFSLIHSTIYSIIAIQQMNLVQFYPSIFWATARLMVESDSIDFIHEDLELLADERDEDEEVQAGKSVNYFKMAMAIGKIRDFGIGVFPPDINRSNFTFSPDLNENAIYFGLKGISRIGNKLIEDIVANRPYTSLDDFLNRVKTNKIQATMLIKAGAFDSFGNREDLLFHYCDREADKKKRVTLQNFARLVELRLVPEELYAQEVLFKLNRFLRKNNRYGDILLFTDDTIPFVEELGYPYLEYDMESAAPFTYFADWEKWRKDQMSPARDWTRENQQELLEKINKAAVQDLLDKYATGNKAKHEMEALSYYHSYHELDAEEYSFWLQNDIEISNFFNLPEEPIVAQQWASGAKRFQLFKIAGTAIGRDKSKGIVGFLTPQGFVTVRVYRSTFAKFDKQIKLDGLTEKSWFTKGSKLLLQGYRSGANFILKTYKGQGQMLYQITGPGQLKNKRLGEN